MQSLAHNDRSHYMWDGIVCLADKPVESESVRAKPKCVCVCVCASVRVRLRGYMPVKMQVCVRRLSLSALSVLRPPTGTQNQAL